ncbi:hypothetical protein H6F88_29430 [Oculatella sp. FACHB-28]|uniref:hypothetical protein n=1 Tax=Cyanophyceae TaxID=3028117 RepID=UPI00168A1CA3|nr:MULTISPECIES: hypothetical protein [Cyanophyceae]MBD2000506.1 hypothetical protein [Leptolyngbya sp. FACHB-541]MBD2060066.1 hypothetical protein [Oculatella sp. FACHB-28]
MTSIREIVHCALETGYLSVSAEDQLRHLLQKTQYDWEDLNAFIHLQQAAMRGHIHQESREVQRSAEYQYF